MPKDESNEMNRSFEPCDEIILYDVANSVMESLNHCISEDSFENYAAGLRIRVCANPAIFRRRFISGYAVLLETLRKTRVDDVI